MSGTINSHVKKSQCRFSVEHLPSHTPQGRRWEVPIASLPAWRSSSNEHNFSKPKKIGQNIIDLPCCIALRIYNHEKGTFPTFCCPCIMHPWMEGGDGESSIRTYFYMIPFILGNNLSLNLDHVSGHGRNQARRFRRRCK